MTSWTRKAVATGEITDAMGADPIGYIAYHADGRMMALVVNRHRAKLKRAMPTDDEKIAPTSIPRNREFNCAENIGETPCGCAFLFSGKSPTETAEI